MKKTALLMAVVAALILGPGASAWGSLVARDLVPGSGDGLLTFDPLTGMEWLDLSATRGLSYAAISNASSGNLVDSGFRYADANDLWLFYQHAGVDFLGKPADYSTHAASYYARNEAGVKNLLRCMSPTIAFGSFQEAVGMYVLYDANGNFLQLRAASVHLNEDAFESWVTISDTPYSPTVNTSSSLYASYLVRDPLPTPLPGAVIFLGSGLAALSVLSRRWRRN
ncbi:MAG: hypothetical protein KKA54_08825 [Proteobacteria bacterium]|nr:hypothetical protein [Pseudomonadota bacterium]MBU0966472.1 hypothetical protein [Pseudomonadota bacterium]